MSRRVRVKICGVGDAREVALAAASGADAIGFVSGWKTPEGRLDDAQIEALMRQVPSGPSKVLLTPYLSPEAMIAHAVRCGADTLQICDHVPVAYRYEVRAALPEVRLLQVAHMGGAIEVSEVVGLAEGADGLLLDSGVSGASFSERGGTGRVHDWEKSRAVVASVNTPVWLAGGLTPNNVLEAVSTVRPYGVDVCSGLRDQGVLSRRLVRQFMDALKTSAGG